jgi:hypothetical protein
VAQPICMLTAVTINGKFKPPANKPHKVHVCVTYAMKCTQRSTMMYLLPCIKVGSSRGTTSVLIKLTYFRWELRDVLKCNSDEVIVLHLSPRNSSSVNSMCWTTGVWFWHTFATTFTQPPCSGTTAAVSNNPHKAFKTWGLDRGST